MDSRKQGRHSERASRVAVLSLRQEPVMVNVANAPVDPVTHPRKGGLHGPGGDPLPLGAKSQIPAIVKGIKRLKPPFSVSVRLIGGATNVKREIQIVEDPAARDKSGELVRTKKSGVFTRKLFQVVRNGVNHYVSVVVPILGGEEKPNFASCNIFHHPSGNQHGHGIADTNYDPPSKPWLEIMESYTLGVGTQHAAHSKVPLIIPLIRIAAWSGANGNNFVFGDHAMETLKALMVEVSGVASPPDMLHITTSSFSNGVQSQAQTLTRFPTGFIDLAIDYDSSIAAPGTMNFVPTKKRRVVRYSQAPGVHAATKEWPLPYNVWPTTDWLNKRDKPPQIPAWPAMSWIHGRIVGTFHYHAVG